MNARFLLLLVAACSDAGRFANKEAPTAAPAPEAPGGYGGLGGEGSGLGGGGYAEGAKAKRAEGAARADGILGLAEAAPAASVAMDAEKKDQAEAAPTRSWFPESFLWMPSVQTDASGVANVTFPVPDSLTTWRVLGLGWTRDGAQAGAELRVQSTLPAYVDVVVPYSLYAGDKVALPVQVMNTTGADVSGALDVTVSGASGAGHGSLRVPAGSSATQRVNVTAERAGVATVHAQFGSVDTVERQVPVRPAGRPEDVSGAGAVGGAVVDVPAGTPGGDAELQVVVWSGAASVVRDEIVGSPMPLDEAKIAAPGVEDAAYHFALALAGAHLDPADVPAESLRALRIRSWLPLTRAGRAPDTRTACLLAEALRDAPAHTLEGDLHDRMVEQVRREQAPDGTWLVGASTIDGTLAATAACARAAGADDGVRLRAEGAFARNVARLEDPYLAAWALASGAVAGDEERVARLTATVTGALVRDTNGAHLPAGGSMAADGRRVTDAEATAVAALALHDHRDDATALATGLLALRRPWGGWGGAADLLAIRALAEVFSLEAPKSASLELVVDGVVAASGSVATDQGHAAVTLKAPWSGAAAKLEVRASPAAPGLVYSWRARSYGAWAATAGGPAEVAVAAPAGARVGQVAEVAVRLAVPTGVAAEVRLGLPAGVRPDPAGMDSLVANAGFAGWDGAEGYVVLHGVPDGGWSGVVPVVPALAGELSSGPSRVYVGDEAVALAVPSRWSIGE